MARTFPLMSLAYLVLAVFCGCGSTDACSGNDCSGHGTCGTSGGSAVCQCDDGYMGQLCDECAAGYHDEDGTCVRSEDCMLDSCDGHGTCDDSTGVVTCDCDEGYAGSRCESCDTGYQDNDSDGTCLLDCDTLGWDCGLHGSCDDSSGTAECACELGHTGATCETCDAGYQDNDGDGSCQPDCATAALDCGTYQVCVDSGGSAECVCIDGHTGAACDVCDTDYQDNDGDGLCLRSCAASGLECSIHGSCSDVSGAAFCICDDEWGGLECNVALAGVEWADIPGGTFSMGSDAGLLSEQPAHQVSVPAFQMMRTEVTMAQYLTCVDAGACTHPYSREVFLACNRGWAGRDDHPVNCVDWQQAREFCAWAGGRLPTEAEWEYAARGGGQDVEYPWGNDPASCDYAVMDLNLVQGDDTEGCGENRTWPVCSISAGNTAQGLCDMAGNVWEWTLDGYHGSYDCDANPDVQNCESGGTAPTDGSAWQETSNGYRVCRGGSHFNPPQVLRVFYRSFGYDELGHYGIVGCRCARRY